MSMDGYSHEDHFEDMRQESRESTVFAEVDMLDLGIEVGVPALHDGRGPFTGTPADAFTLRFCYPQEQDSGNTKYGSALVLDEFGLWHWFRRDFRSIRDLVELGIESDRPDYIVY